MAPNLSTVWQDSTGRWRWVQYLFFFFKVTQNSELNLVLRSEWKWWCFFWEACGQFSSILRALEIGLCRLHGTEPHRLSTTEANFNFWFESVSFTSFGYMIWYDMNTCIIFHFGWVAKLWFIQGRMKFYMILTDKLQCLTMTLNCSLCSRNEIQNEWISKCFYLAIKGKILSLQETKKCFMKQILISLIILSSLPFTSVCSCGARFKGRGNRRYRTCKAASCFL